jgi:SprT-like family protein
VLKRIILAVLILAMAGSLTGQSQRDRLDPWYRGFNDKYFNNELPQNVLITHDVHDDRFVAYTEEYKTGFYHISFNPKLNLSGRQELETLLHESCHIQILSSGETEDDDHGPKWQSCMHELANKGALEELW